MPDQRISDVTFPSRISMDSSSRETMKRARAGDTACGVMSLPAGVVYLAPYAPFDGSGRIAQVSLSPIVHHGGGTPGHQQMVNLLTNQAGIPSRFGYVGFSVLYKPDKGGVGGTSRSQNNGHFRDWSHLDKNKAFSGFHAANKLGGAQLISAPTFLDVTQPGGVFDGDLPAQWRMQIKSFLTTALGPGWSSTLVSSTAWIDRSNSASDDAPPLGDWTAPSRIGS